MAVKTERESTFVCLLFVVYFTAVTVCYGEWKLSIKLVRINSSLSDVTIMPCKMAARNLDIFRSFGVETASWNWRADERQTAEGEAIRVVFDRDR